MQLFINNTPVGVSPQESDTIQDLLIAIKKELEENLIIASMAVDNEYKSMDDPVILGTLVSKVEQIELTVATRIEIGISLLEDGKQFIKIGAQELKNGSMSKKGELINSFAWILESLEALRNSLAFPPIDIPVLKAIITNALKKIDNGMSDLEDMKRLGNELEKVAEHFEILKEKLINEEEFTKENTYAHLKDIQTRLPELATHFQTGNDLEAIQQLCIVIDTIELFTRYVASRVGDTAIEEHALVLKDLSLQLLNAFENKDFVLIADLIEYDLNDCIDNILENED